jgi:hypothetical protein
VRLVLNLLVPPLRLMRFNAPFRVFWMFGLCFGAGLGLHALQTGERARRELVGAAAAWLALGALALAGLFAWAASRGAPLFRELPLLVLPFALSAPLALLLCLRVRSKPLLAAALALLTAAESAAHCEVGAFTLYSPDTALLEQALARHVSTTGPAAASPRSLQQPGSFNAGPILKQPFVRGYSSLVNAAFDRALATAPFADVLSRAPRFWLAPAAEPAPERAQGLAALSSLGASSPLPLFAESAQPFAPARRVVPGSYGAVQIDRYTPEEIALTAAVPPEGGLLASTERLTPGWRAFVDGSPAPALRTNYFFRAVSLPPGRHQVVWRYQPALFWPLTALSCAAQLAVLLLAWFFSQRTRDDKSNQV